MNLLFLSLTTLFLFLTTITTTTATTKFGVTFDETTPRLPPLSTIVTALTDNKISLVRLINPTPSTIYAFSNTSISLLISIPNSFIELFATDNSSCTTWINTYILPFHETTRISLISISTPRLNPFHIHALRNLYESLQQLGIDIRVSVTFPYETILRVKDWFSPSQTRFYRLELMVELVHFLKSIDSAFVVAVYPYDLVNPGYLGIPEDFALFENDRLYMRGDVYTGIEYWNLFDMMVDAIGYALQGIGESDFRVIVAETGWPCKAIDKCDDSGSYLYGLMDHLKKSGSNKTHKPIDEVYVYELIGDRWGILDHEMRLKHSGLDFEVDEVTGEDTKDFIIKVLKWYYLGLVSLVIVCFVLRKFCGLKLLKVQ